VAGSLTKGATSSVLTFIYKAAISRCHLNIIYCGPLYSGYHRARVLSYRTTYETTKKDPKRPIFCNAPFPYSTSRQLGAKCHEARTCQPPLPRKERSPVWGMKFGHSRCNGTQFVLWKQKVKTVGQRYNINGSIVKQAYKKLSLPKLELY